MHPVCMKNLPAGPGKNAGKYDSCRFQWVYSPGLQICWEEILPYILTQDLKSKIRQGIFFNQKYRDI